jgi:acyl dehydratase
MSIQSLQLGAKATRTQTITDETIRAFAELTGDCNPIHIDKAYAAHTRYRKCIAHGLIAAALISATLSNDLPGPGTVYLSQTLRFKAPVYPGDTVTAIVEVKALHPFKPIGTIATTCLKQDGKVVLEGEAVVLFNK